MASRNGGGAASNHVEAIFDEDFGGEVKRGGTHRRAVLFVKPDFWVVLDTLDASDGRPIPRCTLPFDAKVKTDGVRAVTQNTGGQRGDLMPVEKLSLKAER